MICAWPRFKELSHLSQWSSGFKVVLFFCLPGLSNTFTGISGTIGYTVKTAGS